MNKQRARAYLFICTTVIFWGISFFWTSKLLKAQIQYFFWFSPESPWPHWSFLWRAEFLWPDWKAQEKNRLALVFWTGAYGAVLLLCWWELRVEIHRQSQSYICNYIQHTYFWFDCRRNVLQRKVNTLNILGIVPYGTRAVVGSFGNGAFNWPTAQTEPVPTNMLWALRFCLCRW